MNHTGKDFLNKNQIFKREILYELGKIGWSVGIVPIENITLLLLLNI